MNQQTSLLSEYKCVFHLIVHRVFKELRQLQKVTYFKIILYTKILIRILSNNSQQIGHLTNQLTRGILKI